MRMKKSFALTFMAGFVALLSAVSQPVFAGSAACSGACTTPNVNLDFQVVIPQVMRLRIGNPAAPDTITFDMSSTPNLVGDGSSVSGTGGDFGGGEVNVQVLANGGATSVQVDADVSDPGSGIACTGGGCTPGSHWIVWDQIQVTGGTFACSVPPPVLDNNGTGFATYNASAGGVVNESCTWRYTYLNGVFPVNGTYSGTVFYTATLTP